jgi:hypothetical protein
MLQRLIDSTPYDEIDTPHEALEPLLSYLPRTLWEMCPGQGNLVHHLVHAGHDVFTLEGDSLQKEPVNYYDAIVTNPPYSNKHEWLQRCQELDKPFALLLPVTTLGVRRCQIWMDDIDVLFLPRRIDFTGKKAPWFAVCWITKGLLPDRIIFADDMHN